MRSIFGRFKGGASIFFTVIVIIIVLGLLLAFSSQFFYLFERVDEQEVGVQFRGGRIHDIVGPGVYSDFGLFVDMVRVSSQAIPFSVTDEEIITKDKQRIGLVVSGDIFRPELPQKEILRSSWAQYRGIYLDDELARSRVQDLARQAMKVCVGDRTFDDNIIHRRDLARLGDAAVPHRIGHQDVRDVFLHPLADLPARHQQLGADHRDARPIAERLDLVRVDGGRSLE